MEHVAVRAGEPAGHPIDDSPERANSAALLQLMVDRATRISLADEAGAVARTLRPMVEGFLKDKGIPLDLSGLGKDARPIDARTILSLPIELARHRRKPTILFLDELQRAVSYADGDEILTDLVDLYRASGDVVLLVDGTITDFDLEMGLDEARRHLEDDGA